MWTEALENSCFFLYVKTKSEISCAVNVLLISVFVFAPSQELWPVTIGL